MASMDGVDEAAASRSLRYALDFGIADDPAAVIAVDVFWPRETLLPIVLFCLPGGGMNRRFYDLAGADARYSFARQMAARGFISVLIDPPGIGDSDRPQDGYALTPARITDILTQLHTRVCQDLRSGAVDADLPALPQLQTIGVGHSMGAMLTVLQQEQTQCHAAVALLGFATHGLPQYLSAEARALAADTQAVRAQMVPLARQMFAAPYPDIRHDSGNELYGGAAAEPEAVQALKAARDRLLPVPAFMSILPDNVAPEAAQLKVPVFQALGERDFVRQSNQPKAGFAASCAVEFVSLADTGHSFFLFKSRAYLFDRLARWARGVADIC